MHSAQGREGGRQGGDTGEGGRDEIRATREGGREDSLNLETRAPIINRTAHCAVGNFKGLVCVRKQWIPGFPHN